MGGWETFAVFILLLDCLAKRKSIILYYLEKAPFVHRPALLLQECNAQNLLRNQGLGLAPFPNTFGFGEYKGMQLCGYEDMQVLDMWLHDVSFIPYAIRRMLGH